jgi:peptidoglycan/LPS O-acetylase OafA/YrhL
VTVRAQGAVERTGPSQRTGRLDFLDGLRGVAVALVLAQHVGERAFPAVAGFTHSSLQLGQLGVMLFFLCSGFIIPASLERGRADDGRGRRLAAFWRGRFFRLFPLYWVSLAAALWFALGGGYVTPEAMSPADWALNVSMLQMLAGSPNALVAYWSLAFELVFYASLSALFLVGWHRRSVALSLAASGICLVVAIGAALLGGAAPTGVFCLATMVTGTVFYRWHSGEADLRSLLVCVLGTAIAAPAVLASALLTSPQPPEAPQFLAMLTAWLGAYGLFALGILLRGRRVPGWLRWLGTVSYSVYLMQGVVLIAVAPLADPVLSAVVWVVATLALSGATYRLVEQPSIRMSRMLGRRTAASTAQPGTSAPSRLMPEAAVVSRAGEPLAA